MSSETFEIRLVASDLYCPFTVYSLHHHLTNCRARLFFDKSEAESVAKELDPELWEGGSFYAPPMLEDIDRVCGDLGLKGRAIHGDRDSGFEFLAVVYGSPAILAAVADAEREAELGADHVE